MTSPMIEHVARAICVANERDPDKSLAEYGSPTVAWQIYEREARVAIEAMRMPLPHMIRAGADAHSATDARSDMAYAIGCQDVIDAWQAMIDAALSDPLPDGTPK